VLALYRRRPGENASVMTTGSGRGAFDTATWRKPLAFAADAAGLWVLHSLVGYHVLKIQQLGWVVDPMDTRIGARFTP